MEFDPQVLLFWYAAFVLSTTAHEAAHAYVALIGGDPTAYLGGQVTLNPIPHMRREPFGMVAMPLLFLAMSGWCFGWASTPYDPAWERRFPRRAAWMSAAGPAANLALAVLALLALRVGLAMGAFDTPSSVSLSQMVGASSPGLLALGSFLSVMLFLNTILCLFNLIPLPPLDGSSAIGLVLPEDLVLRLRAAVSSGPLPLFLMLGLWWSVGSVIVPLWSGLLALVHPGVSYG